MKHIQKLLALWCALVMIASGMLYSAYAESPATPTDLEPAEEQEEPGEPEEEPAEEPEEAEEETGDSTEVIITKALKIGESWSGIVSRSKPAVLKLDPDAAETVYMLLEGKNILARIRKADRPAEELPNEEEDLEADRILITWDAELASYLITVTPDEGSLMAKAQVTFMDSDLYAVWEAENISGDEQLPEATQEDETAEDDEVQPEAEPENNTSDEPQEEEPAEEDTYEEEESEEEITNRSITVDVTWDTPDPVIGDTAHFKATLKGYKHLTYTMQWQYSVDRNEWTDIPGATGKTMDVVVTNENNLVYWRIVVYVEEDKK